MADHPLIGTWTLEEFAFTDAAGETVHPLGKAVTGGVTFTGDGHMALTFAAAGRAPFADDDLLGGSDAEQAAAARTYISFGARYRIEADAVAFEIAYSLHPNWVGVRQRRLFEIAGEALVLRTPGPIRIKGALLTGGARLKRA